MKLGRTPPEAEKLKDRTDVNPWSFISPKVEIKKSLVHGVGMFTKEKIIKGEIVFIKGGHVISRDKVFTSKKIYSYLPIDDDYLLGATSKDEEEDIKLNVNHSCSPNCGVRGEITFVAMRVINIGEELTIDYAMVDNEEYEFACTCGKIDCRKKVTGFDWQIKELQYKYGDYFARYLLEKMA